MKGHIVVLGGAGRYGRAAAEAFRAAGWSVTSLVRGSSAERAAPGTAIVEVDARDRDSVIEAARGADVILHALNPTFTQWGNDALPFTETAIAAAQAAGATLVLPGNLYNYGAGQHQRRARRLRRRRDRGLEVQSVVHCVKVVIERVQDHISAARRCAPSRGTVDLDDRGARHDAFSRSRARGSSRSALATRNAGGASERPG